MEASSDRIPLVDLAVQHRGLATELRAALDRLLGSSAFTLGEEVERFERDYAAYCGTRHCVGTASGTAALTLALEAAAIGAGDEVIVPAHTFVASALAVVHAGATPVLCDVEDGTGLIDPRSADDCVSERTAAVMAVHLYGQVCDIGPLAALAERHGLLLIEDAAQAHGATYDGRRAGSLGRIAGFSFYPSKNLGALGDAGAITTDDTEIAERARLLRDLGRRGRGEHVLPGSNERLDGLQAAFLRVKLEHLDAWNAARRERAAHYRKALGAGLRVLEEREPGSSVWHLFPSRVRDRETLRARLSDAGVETGIHYSPALHEQPALVGRSRPAGELKSAEAWAREELSLPIFPELTPAQVERVASLCAPSV